MKHGTEIDTSALTIGRWEFSERESATGITVCDAAGRALARVPRRDDDLDIARAIRALPDVLAALERIRDTEPLNTRHGQIARDALALTRRQS